MAERNRTDPSHKATLAPLGWGLEISFLRGGLVAADDMELHVFHIEIARFHPVDVGLAGFDHHDRVRHAIFDVTKECAPWDRRKCVWGPTIIA